MDLFWFLLLICPLMMLFMMFGLKGMPGRGSHSHKLESDWSIHDDYNELKVQNDQMKKELQILSSQHNLKEKNQE